MQKVNIQNERFGMLVAIEETKQRDFGNVIWKCKCDCRKIVYKSTSYLSKDRMCSCGCYAKMQHKKHRRDISKQRFGSLVAVEPTGKSNNRKVRIWKYPQNILLIEQKISRLQSDMEMYQSNKPIDKDVFAMTIRDELYTDKKEAAIALMEVCGQIKAFQADRKAGEYLGFSLKVSYDYFNDKIVMDIMGNESRKIEIGMDPLGNITRINNALEGMSKQLGDMQTLLDNTKRQLENAKIEVDKPFVKEAELSEKMERLAELNALLNMDEKDSDAIMIGDDAEEEDENISGLEGDSEMSEAEENVEIAKDSKKPAERPSLKKKLEIMKGKAAELSAEKKELKPHIERGDYDIS